MRPAEIVLGYTFTFIGLWLLGLGAVRRPRSPFLIILGLAFFCFAAAVAAYMKREAL